MATHKPECVTQEGNKSHTEEANTVACDIARGRRELRTAKQLMSLLVLPAKATSVYAHRDRTCSSLLGLP